MNLQDFGSWRLSFTATCLLLCLSAVVDCKGGVVHPKDGGPNSEKYCAERPEVENNCMGCSSQPGCGYCAEPAQGRPHCQPARGEAAPSSCESGWAQSTEQCDLPPPPLPEATGE